MYTRLHRANKRSTQADQIPGAVEQSAVQSPEPVSQLPHRSRPGGNQGIPFQAFGKPRQRVVAAGFGFPAPLPQGVEHGIRALSTALINRTQALAEFVDRGKVGPLRAECARSEEHTSELQSLMRISYAVFCLKTKKTVINIISHPTKSRL